MGKRMPVKVRKLIDRLERAKKADRRIDIAIARDIFKYTIQGEDFMVDPFYQLIRYVPIPKYTLSLDAACCLIPDGSQWSIHREGAVVDGFDAQAATPAISLVIASLKAQYLR